MKENQLSDLDVDPNDPLDCLELSARAYNALRRAEVHTVGQLVELAETKGVESVRNIGKKSQAEIERKLSRVRLVSVSVGEDMSDTGAHVEPLNVPKVPQIQVIETLSKEVLEWQAQFIMKQIDSGLLHPHASLLGRSISSWLSLVGIEENQVMYQVMATILSNSLNICDELASLLHRCRRHEEFVILVSRYGTHMRTLQEIGLQLGMTRERVRQIAEKIIRSIVATARRSSLIRIQSALLIAQDMGPDITFDDWVRGIKRSGLLGHCQFSNKLPVDPIDILVAVCRVLDSEDVRGFKLPENLRCARELATLGMPQESARKAQVLEGISGSKRRLIRRHAKYSGAVYAKWLSHEMGINIGRAREILQALGYRSMSEDWFRPSFEEETIEIGRHDVFHHALRKMSQVCGPLSIDDICSGLRSAVSRTEFPIPPPHLLEELLCVYGYSCEDALWYWDKNSDEHLAESEQVILRYLQQENPVAQHSELVQAFLNAGLSQSALSATLNISPLFARIGTGLYKLRGMRVSENDIARATASGEKVSIDPVIGYDKSGKLFLEVGVSTNVIGTGVICSDQFPNLSGEWQCEVAGRGSGILHAAENEFRHLKEIFRQLNCESGDRIRFVFDMWSRSVQIEKVEE